MIPPGICDTELVFWDFDGVIKDSVEVKAAAFEQLFVPFGKRVAGQVREHHEANSGVSRYDKIPIYLEWSGQSATGPLIMDYCEKFARLVLQAVIDSAWVPGAREYLLRNRHRQRFVLVSATPQLEIAAIVAELQISHCFREVHGAPIAKASAVRDALRRWRCSPERALFLGDSEADLHAAGENHVPFRLRRTALNVNLHAQCGGLLFDDFLDQVDE